MAIAAYALALQEQICYLANLPLIVQLEGVERNPTFEKCKNLPLESNDMQKVKPYFLRIMTGYGKNEGKKRWKWYFWSLNCYWLWPKERPKLQKHVDRGWRATKHEK